VRISEIVVAGFAVYVAAVALLPRWSARQRAVAGAFAAALLLPALALASVTQTPAVVMIRDWVPAIDVFFAYYACGAFFNGPLASFEDWLRRWDDRLLGAWMIRRRPASVFAALEVVYAGTFLMIPGGYAVLVGGGYGSRADHYWTLVLLAEFGAFAMLPWLPSRPPWFVEDLQPADASGIRRLSLIWVRRASHCANTFPSGHAAGTLAVAFAVLPVMPVAGSVHYRPLSLRPRRRRRRGACARLVGDDLAPR
jgi:hypothetical protein